jgi:O-succinylbenzoate synthase
VPLVSRPASNDGAVREHRVRVGAREVTLLEGPAGWGEWSPLAGYPCDPEVCRQAAVEAATLGFPPAVRSEVPVNALVDGPFLVQDVRGFPAVKVKVRSVADVALLSAVRDAVGPTVKLRIDANGAWDVDTAIEMIERCARYDLELVEQPVASIDDLARVRRSVRVPIAADECIRTIDDARRLRALEAADVIVVKQQPLGGVRAALAVVEAAGVPAIVTSMMETSVGISAGLALAAALPELLYACGLGTASLLDADVTSDPLVPIDGVVRVRSVVPDLVVNGAQPPVQELPIQERTR